MDWYVRVPLLEVTTQPLPSPSLPSDEEIKEMAIGKEFITGSAEYGYTKGATDMRSICSTRIAEMERDIKRLEALNKQYSSFRRDVLQIPDELIIEIDNKHFPF